MSTRWSVYWDRIDLVWRAEPHDWNAMDRAPVNGMPTWREAFDYADREARR